MHQDAPVDQKGTTGRSSRQIPNAYPPIGDYAFISDCHSTALVSTDASIDWCCLRRVDAGSCFGRLLDWQQGGYCSITPSSESYATHREYVSETMVLKTTFTTGGGEATVIDCFAMRSGGREQPLMELIRIIEGVRGKVDFDLDIVPRFDYGEMRPWLRRAGIRTWAVIGGDDGMLVSSDLELVLGDHHDLRAQVSVHGEERMRLVIQAKPPTELDGGAWDPMPGGVIDEHLKSTVTWWRRWAKRATFGGPDRPAVLRSALVLKGLTNAPTGAIAAAATTSLPEEMGGPRNWDYRYSWIRDSYLSVHSLALIGCDREADGFRRFMQRSSAGSAHELQIMYGVGGERRLTEIELPLEGYRGSRPVRIGNAATEQLQLDAYGELLLLTWIWHRRGHSPDDDYWRFLADLVDVAAERWAEPDSGIWEMRGPRRHFVHSKVMCWAAVDRGIQLAVECMRQAPLNRWRKTLKEMRESIDANGVDSKRGCFVQSYKSKELDAALLTLPNVGYCEYDDPRMVATVQAIRENLEQEGLVLRYRTDKVNDGVGGGREGYFLACTFWLVDCLAGQRQYAEAREVFDRATAAGNDLGLFAEEFDPQSGELLGNFPQAFTHLAHIAAAVRLSEAGRS